MSHITTLRCDPCFPSRACRYSSGPTGSAYRACGEAASALHAMVLLQVHQAKALKDLHEGGHGLVVLHELRATKVTAQSLGHAMSTVVVQEHHLRLCLADMKELEKVQFLNAPVSQTGLFGNAVKSFAQQFSATQKQTEAIKHIMRQRKSAASTPAAVPQPARRRGCPPVATLLWPPSLPRIRSSLPPCSIKEPVAESAPSPSRPWRQAQVQEALRRATQRWRRLLIRRWWMHHSLPRRRAGWRIFRFVFFFYHPKRRSTKPKRVVSSVSGSQEEESCKQQWVAQEHPSRNQVRVVTLESPLHVVTRQAVTSFKPGSCVFLPHEEESGEC